MREILKQEFGDKMISYAGWAFFLPLLALAIGNLANIDEINRSAIFVFDITVLLAGFGELLTPRGGSLHRFTNLASIATAAMLFSLAVAWANTPKEKLPSSFMAQPWIPYVATVLTFLTVCGDIFVGVNKKCHEEVDRWIKLLPLT